MSVVLVALAACGGGDGEPEAPAATEETSSSTAVEAPAVTRISPGLTLRVLEEGDGETASVGQTAVVHYTGWFHDPEAPDNRGEMFDSSRERDQHFRFVLGAGHVIQGWDQGVVGMKVGEVRELTIAPELAYGERGAGDAIPPNSTLVFEIELAALEEGTGTS